MSTPTLAPRHVAWSNATELRSAFAARCRANGWNVLKTKADRPMAEARFETAPAFNIAHFALHNLKVKSEAWRGISHWNHMASRIYFPLFTQDPCQHVTVVSDSRGKCMDGEAPQHGSFDYRSAQAAPLVQSQEVV